MKRISNYIFLIDALGATLTTILLLGVLKRFNEYFKIPQESLTILAIFSASLALFSFLCFSFAKNRFKKFLTFIIVANIIYCNLTMVYLFANLSTITLVGLIYFVAEILIIFILVYLEFNVLKKN